MFIVDSHCHLDALDYENLHKDIADVVTKANARDVKHLLAIGVTDVYKRQHSPLSNGRWI